MTRRLKITSLLICLFLLTNLNAQVTYELIGKTLDSLDAPIDYVNIGIAGKNIGTVSGNRGLFNLRISEKYITDSLTFSRIGYQTRKMIIRDLIAEKNLTILLIPKISEIKEVEIISQKLNRKRKGNFTRSEKIVMGIKSNPEYLGKEIGTVIRLPNHPIILKDFNFHIVSFRPDSAKYRLNLYEFDRNEIGQNILNENIYFTVRKEDIGDFILDLSSYQIHTSQDLFVAIEVIGVYVSEGPNPDFKFDEYHYDKILISGMVARGSKSFMKQISFGNWEKTPYSFSPGFWITYLD